MRLTKKGLYIVGIVVLLVVYGGLFAFTTVKINSWRLQRAETLLLQSQKTKDQEKSLAFLQEAALISPTENTYLKAGIKAQKMGLNKISAYYLSRVKTAKGYADLGKAYFNDGQFTLAESVFKKSASLDDNASVDLLLGKTYLKDNKLSLAETSLEQSKRLANGAEETNYYLTLISLMEKTTGYQQTETYLTGSYKQKIEEVLQYPNEKTQNNEIFSLFLAQGYPQIALGFLQGEADHGLIDRDGYLLLAKEYFSLKNYQKSYSLLLSAKNLDNYYPQTYQHLIEVANILGLKSEAIRYQSFYNLLVVGPADSI